MEIHFTQIYIQAGVSFPFSCAFQKFMGTKVTGLVIPSLKFTKGHGGDYSLEFNISAKWQLAVNEIVGPARYKKDKSVEYSIFLPYTPIMQQSEPYRRALYHIFESVYEVLEGYEIDTSKLKAEQEELITEIILSPEMFRHDEK